MCGALNIIFLLTGAEISYVEKLLCVANFKQSHVLCVVPRLINSSCASLRVWEISHRDADTLSSFTKACILSVLEQGENAAVVLLGNAHAFSRLILFNYF